MVEVRSQLDCIRQEIDKVPRMYKIDVGDTVCKWCVTLNLLQPDSLCEPP
jgi:hypothetical protein